MSGWTPKVGDKVMVGEDGPYEVTSTGPVSDLGTSVRIVHHPSAWATWVPSTWLTPAPEPEPDEPTAPGSLVRDGAGRLWVRDDSHEWPWGCLAPYGDDNRWAQLFRPIAVVLADPAEVEQLRDQLTAVALEAKRFHKERDEARSERDELQRRIDKSRGLTLGDVTPSTPNALLVARDKVLRGES